MRYRMEKINKYRSCESCPEQMDVINFSPSDITFLCISALSLSILILNKHRLQYNNPVFNYSTTYLLIEIPRFRMSKREKKLQNCNKFNHDYIYRSFIKRFRVYRQCALSVHLRALVRTIIYDILCTHE